MRIGKGSAQTILVGWHDDDVHMIGHQAITPDFCPCIFRRLGQKVSIIGVVGFFEESPFPPVAALGHVIGNTGQHKSGESGHADVLTHLL